MPREFDNRNDVRSRRFLYRVAEADRIGKAFGGGISQ